MRPDDEREWASVDELTATDIAQVGDVAVRVVRREDIGLAVQVDVTDGDRVRTESHEKGRAVGLSELACAVAEENGHAAAGVVRDGDVELAVQIEVTHGDRVRRVPAGGRGGSRGES